LISARNSKTLYRVWELLKYIKWRWKEEDTFFSKGLKRHVNLRYFRKRKNKSNNKKWRLKGNRQKKRSKSHWKRNHGIFPKHQEQVQRLASILGKIFLKITGKDKVGRQRLQ
jgi:hypothetical protein